MRETFHNIQLNHFSLIHSALMKIQKQCTLNKVWTVQFIYDLNQTGIDFIVHLVYVVTTFYVCRVHNMPLPYCC